MSIEVGGQPPQDRLLARPDRTGQSAVIDAVRTVPKRLAQFDATPQDLDLLRASGRRIRWDEIEIFVGNEVFIVTVTQDRFKNVFTGTHFSSTATPRDHQLKSQK